MAARLRRATAEDLERIVEIQGVSPEASQWAFEAYRRALDDPTHLLLVAVEPERPAGFLLGRRQPPDAAEILNFAVDPTCRRRGLGAALLDHFLDQTRAEVWAEVRASNAAAVALYRSRGFERIGRRRRYYHSPVEDALLLLRPAR